LSPQGNILITLLRARASLVSIVAVCVALLAGCTAEGQKQNIAKVRVFNTVFDSPGVRVSLPEKDIGNGLAYGARTTYTDITSGVLPVTVTSAAGEKLFESNFNFGNERPTTVVITGLVGAYSALAFDDVVNPPQEGRVRARILHAASSIASLDAYLTKPGESITDLFPTSSVSYGLFTGFLEFNADTYILRFTNFGTKDVVYESEPIVMSSRSTLSLMAYSTGSQRMFGAARFNHDETGASTLLPSKLARVRVANAVTATPLNILLDGTQVAENIAANAFSPGFDVTVGSRTLRIDPNATAGTQLASAALTFAPGREYTVLASGNGTAATLVALVDNTESPNLITKIRLRIVNGVVGGEAAILKVGTTTLSTVNAGGAGTYVEQDIGTLNITVTGVTSGATLFSAPAREFLGTDVGKRYSILLSGTPAAVESALVNE